MSFWAGCVNDLGTAILVGAYVATTLSTVILATVWATMLADFRQQVFLLSLKRQPDHCH